jgi:predicted amino acid dehydrogenase
MIGVEFRRLLDNPSFLLRLLTTQDDLVFVLVGYFFNVHRIRVAPTLSDPQTIRIEPSLVIADHEIDRFLAALEDVCVKLRQRDVIGLTRYFVEGGDRSSDVVRVASDAKYVIYEESSYWQRELNPPPIRVAWLFHLRDADDMLTLDAAASHLTTDERERYLRHFAPRSNPVVMNSVDVKSITGATVRFYPILLPHTSRQMKEALEEHDFFRVRHSIDKAIAVAKHIGCDVVALGQYTSIVTRNATSFHLPDVGVTTGNSYTIWLAIDAITLACEQRGVAKDEATLVVVGASGNIGQTCAEILGPQFRRTILVGSGKASARRRLEELQSRVPRTEISTDPMAVALGEVVLAATNAPEPFLAAEHFARNAVVCDLSVPAAVRPDVRALRPDVLVLNGGIARLPFGEDHGIAGFPLTAGHVYGCMGETMLLGLEGIRDATFTGMLPVENVYRLKAMAERHGFALADFKLQPTMGDADALRTNG